MQIAWEFFEVLAVLANAGRYADVSEVCLRKVRFFLSTVQPVIQCIAHAVHNNDQALIEGRISDG